MKQYTTVKVSGVIISVSEKTDIPGYTKTIIEPLLPSDNELETMSKKEEGDFIKRNNKIMQAVCDYMNSKEFQGKIK